MRLVRSVLEKSWGRWRERKGLRTGTEAQAMAKVSSTCLFCRSREWGLIGKGGGGGKANVRPDRDGRPVPRHVAVAGQADQLVDGPDAEDGDDAGSVGEAIVRVSKAVEEERPLECV